MSDDEWTAADEWASWMFPRAAAPPGLRQVYRELRPPLHEQIEDYRKQLESAMTDEADYETAWKDLVQRLGGSIDGVEKAVDHGSSKAAKDLDLLREVQEVVDEVAEEHGVEKIWELPAGYDPTQK